MKQYLVHCTTDDGKVVYHMRAPDELTVRREASKFYPTLRRIHVYETDQAGRIVGRTRTEIRP